MKYSVSPLTCGRCVITITQALLAVEPDARVTVNLAAGTVDFDGALDAAAVAATAARTAASSAGLSRICSAATSPASNA